LHRRWLRFTMEMSRRELPTWIARHAKTYVRRDAAERGIKQSAVVEEALETTLAGAP